MFQLAWSLRFQADCLNHLMGLFLFATQRLEPPNTWWLRGCMSQMFSKTVTGYCALWCHHSLLDALLRGGEKTKKKLDPEWHHHHEKPYWCDVAVHHRLWQQTFHPRGWTRSSHRKPLKMQANLQGSCESSCVESKAMLSAKGIQIDQCPVGVGKVAKR